MGAYRDNMVTSRDEYKMKSTSFADDGFVILTMFAQKRWAGGV
jgi:hypothetical protein